MKRKREKEDVEKRKKRTKRNENGKKEVDIEDNGEEEKEEEDKECEWQVQVRVSCGGDGSEPGVSAAQTSRAVWSATRLPSLQPLHHRFWTRMEACCNGISPDGDLLNLQATQSVD
ncbi:hypothetical protein LSTR_LSTR007745 [Laodelphax striatellus]|uniref:Uncharacterized protein n=1 Tax=Laodelphax striatellus TaxID=195883 RepID=A0A482WJL0_LAOST|nr:hypothetical protein LSTR_LSTR007745 [Laodelphax striatellus]